MNSKLIFSLYLDVGARGHADLIQKAWSSSDLLFKSFECPPSFSSFRIDGAGRLKNNKTYDYRRIRRVAQQAVDDGAIRTFTLYGVEQPDFKQLSFDWTLLYSAGSYFSKVSNVFLVQAGVDCSFMQPMAIQEKVSNVMETFLDHNSLVYGHVFLMPCSFHPAGYGIGLAGDAPSTLVKSINRWRVSLPRWGLSIPRDVFPLNYLSDQHLKRTVGSKTLEAFIQDGNGRLSTLGPNLFEWRIAAKEGDCLDLVWDQPEVLRIRSELISHGFFPWYTE